MSPLDESIRKLAELSSDLNDKTDDLNKVIAACEQKLQGAQIGVAVWLDVGHCRLANTPRKGGGTSYWLLGYEKLGDEWRLAARRHETHYEWSGEFAGSQQVDSAGDTVPLLKAPRIVRVEAAPLLARLIDQLTKRVQKFLSNIDSAKNLLKN